MALKIVCISDTHEKHRFLNIPEGDVLVHTGDFTFRGDFYAIKDFADWMQSLNFKHKICIAGNHELTLDPNFSTNGSQRPIMLNLLKNAGITYLQDSGIEIEGLHFWGAPYTPKVLNWAFTEERGNKIAKKWNKIPAKTNVLLTHCPPYGILDLVEINLHKDVIHQGCEQLVKKIMSLRQLKLHVFGHLHFNYGTEIINDTTFVNAASCNEQYEPYNPPIVVTI